MIEDTLTAIVSELDQSLRRQTPGGGERAKLINLVDAGGAPVAEAADRLAVFLVNIEREVIPTRGLQRVDAGDPDRVAMLRAPVHLNLLVMFAANISGATYNEALKLIERRSDRLPGVLIADRPTASPFGRGYAKRAAGDTVAGEADMAAARGAAPLVTVDFWDAGIVHAP